MKLAIVEVGSNRFLCPSVSIATKLVDLLSKVLEVKWDYVDGTTLYMPHDPESDRPLHVELKLVDPSQVAKPLKRVAKGRRLGPGEPLMPHLDP